MTTNSSLEHERANGGIEGNQRTVGGSDEQYNLHRLHTPSSCDLGQMHQTVKNWSPLVQALSLLLPLFAYSLFTLKFHNFRELCVFLIVAPMVAYTARRIHTQQYHCENILPLAAGLLASFAFLIAPFITTSITSVERDFIACSIPAGWAMLFSLFFLNCHKNDRTPCRAPLLFASALVGVTICLAIWCTGGSKYVLAQPNPNGAPDRFPYTFSIWESNPISAHYFLTFDHLFGEFERKQCYRGYTPVYTLLNYIPLRIARYYSGLEYANLMRLTPFLVGVCGSFLIPISIVWAFACSLERRAQFLFLTLSTTSLILLIPDMWTAPLTFGFDYSTPITALINVLIAVSLVKASSTAASQERRTACALLAFIAMTLPYFGLTLGIILMLMWTGQPRRFFSGVGIVTFITSGLCLISLYLLGKLAGITPKGSAMLSRMGFAQQFDPITAVLTPSSQHLWRPYSFVFLGAIAALFAVVLQIALTRSRKASTLNYLLLGPTLLTIVLFPQSVSIHPDLYDISMAVGGPIALMFLVFGILEENRFPAHRYMPWLATVLCGVILHNIKLIQMCFAKH